MLALTEFSGYNSVNWYFYFLFLCVRVLLSDDETFLLGELLSPMIDPSAVARYPRVTINPARVSTYIEYISRL
jgi:hypothetical protein